jgi:hypothetical protein
MVPPLESLVTAGVVDEGEYTVKVEEFGVAITVKLPLKRALLVKPVM